EADLGHVDPFAFRRPVHVAWRELWLSDEGDTAIAEIRKADGVPACFGCRLLAFENCSEVKGGCRHHTFDHEAGFRHADRYGGRTCGRYGDTYAEREDFREGRIALMLVNDDEAARIGQPFDIANGGHSPESGKHHRIAERQVVRVLERAALVHFLYMHHAGLDAGHARVGDPFDVTVAHFAFEQGLGIADAVQAEMADIGLWRYIGHRHLVTDFAATKLGIEDHREFISRAIARRALNRTHDNRAGIFDKCIK